MNVQDGEKVLNNKKKMNILSVRDPCLLKGSYYINNFYRLAYRDKKMYFPICKSASNVSSSSVNNNDENLVDLSLKSFIFYKRKSLLHNLKNMKENISSYYTGTTFIYQENLVRSFSFLSENILNDKKIKLLKKEVKLLETRKKKKLINPPINFLIMEMSYTHIRRLISLLMEQRLETLRDTIPVVNTKNKTEGEIFIIKSILGITDTDFQTRRSESKKHFIYFLDFLIKNLNRLLLLVVRFCFVYSKTEKCLKLKDSLMSTFFCSSYKVSFVSVKSLSKLVSYSDIITFLKNLNSGLVSNPPNMDISFFCCYLKNEKSKISLKKHQFRLVWNGVVSFIKNEINFSSLKQTLKTSLSILFNKYKKELYKEPSLSSLISCFEENKDTWLNILKKEVNN